MHALQLAAAENHPAGNRVIVVVLRCPAHQPDQHADRGQISGLPYRPGHQFHELPDMPFRDGDLRRSRCRKEMIYRCRRGGRFGRDTGNAQAFGAGARD